MTKVKLGDVAFEYKGKLAGATKSVGLEHLSQGDVDLLGYDEGGDNTFTKAFKEGQVLFGRRRAYLKKASVAPFEGVCSGDLICIEAKEGLLSSRLLPFVIQNDNLFDFAVENSAGSLSPRVKWSSLAEYEFNLPDMRKQEELAELLWAAQELKRQYKKLLSANDEIVKSRFVEMFGDLTRERQGWEYKELGEICGIITGNTPAKKHPEYYGDYVEWIKTDNISKESVVTTAAVCLSEKGAEVGRLVPAGSVLMCCIAGSVKSIGKVALTDRTVAFNQQINALVPGETIRSQFLLWMLRSTKGYLCRNVNMQLKGILNKTTLSKKEYSVPPLDLQDEFVQFISQVDKSGFALKQAIVDLGSMMSALLNEELGLGNV